MNKNYCPICGRNEYSVLRAAKNYDFAQTDNFAFASRKIPEYMHYTIRECKKCKLLYAIDTMPEEQLKELYRKAEFDSENEAGYASKTYYQYLKKYMKNIKGRAMDIGTGEGSYLKCLLKGGGVEEVVGIEPSEAPIEKADKVVKPYIINDIFRSEDFEKNSFDIISCFQTLEHIENPLKLVKSLHEILKEDGKVYIVCHNYASFVNRILGKKSPIYDIEHLQIFSPMSIKKLFLKAGYHNIRVFKIRNAYPLQYWIKLFPFPILLKKKLLSFLGKIKLANIIISFNVGNLGVIADK